MHKVLQFTLLTVAVVLDSRTDAATKEGVRLCGRQLSEIMSRVCHAYNSPSWDAPTVVEQPGSTRRKRQVGIADECCIIGCTWEQLSEYCSVKAYSESPLEEAEEHIIADRSAEQQAKATAASSAPAAVGSAGGGGARGRARGRLRGYGRRGRRCWCRRRRREGRRRSSLMGNTELVRSVSRAAPVVGTVSPLLTWGRTLNTDVAALSRDHLAYVVYT